MPEPIARRVERLEATRTQAAADRAALMGPPVLLAWLPSDEQGDPVAGWYFWPLSEPRMYWVREADESLDRFEARVIGQLIAMGVPGRQGGAGMVFVESREDFLCRLSDRFPSWIRNSGCVLVESDKSVKSASMPAWPPAAGVLLTAAEIPANVSEQVQSSRVKDVNALLRQFAPTVG